MGLGTALFVKQNGLFSLGKSLYRKVSICGLAVVFEVLELYFKTRVGLIEIVKALEGVACVGQVFYDRGQRARMYKS